MTESAPDPRSRKKAANIESLLDHGLRLVAAQGLFACRVEEITAAAGVGKGTFFNYFQTKEAFVAKLVDRVLTDLARRVRPVGLTPSGAEALLEGVGAVHLRYFQLRPEAAALLNQAVGLAGQGEPGERIAQRLGEHLDLVAGMLAPAAESLGWPRERVRELALMIFATSVGFFWFGPAAGLEGPTPSGLLDRLGRSLGRGLAETR